MFCGGGRCSRGRSRGQVRWMQCAFFARENDAQQLPECAAKSGRPQPAARNGTAKEGNMECEDCDSRLTAAAALGLKVEMCGSAHGVYQSDQALLWKPRSAIPKHPPSSRHTHTPIHRPETGLDHGLAIIEDVSPPSSSFWLVSPAHRPDCNPANHLPNARLLGCYPQATQRLPGALIVKDVESAITGAFARH